MTKLKWLMVALLATLTTLFTSVFAWLQVSNINILEDLSLEVGVGDTLEISLDGINFGKSIDKAMTQELLKNLVFTDITTNDNINFYKGPNLKGKVAERNVDYIGLDIWFRVALEPGVPEEDVFKEIYLVNHLDITYQDAKSSPSRGTYITSEGRTWQADFTFDNGHQIVEKGKIAKYYAKDAMRIGVTSLHNAFIYDTSENEERGFGREYGAFEYYNMKTTQKNLELPDVYPETIYQLSREYPNTGIMDSTRSLVVILEKEGDYWQGKATINIWIEGWDADAFDAILKDHILIQLEFQAAWHLDNEG